MREWALAAVLAAGGAPGPLPGRSVRTPAAAPVLFERSCPADWRERRAGDCWTETSVFGGGKARAYVHPRGWVVDPRCFSEPRFTPRELVDALSAAGRKLDPSVPTAAGGCLGEFNPEWGAELTRAVWERKMHVACGRYEPAEDTCAHHEARDDYRQDEQGFLRRTPQALNLLVIRNVGRCMGAGGSGLAGVLFHESLHAAGADNFPAERHNRAWELPQFEFIRDRVYGTEAVCFFGHDPAQRPYVNLFQCRAAVAFRATRPREELCRGFDASFTDLRPPGFLKH